MPLSSAVARRGCAVGTHAEMAAAYTAEEARACGDTGRCRERWERDREIQGIYRETQGDMHGGGGARLRRET